MMNTQVCTRCDTEKPISEYYFSKNNQNGHSTVCLPCVREWYKPEEIKLIIKAAEVPLPKKDMKVRALRRMMPLPEVKKHHGNIYLCVSANGLYKIGRTRNIKSRLGGLNRDIPIEVQLIHSFQSDAYELAELFLHKKFTNERVKFEWFQLSPEQAGWICALKDFDLDGVILDTPVNKIYATKEHQNDDA